MAHLIQQTGVCFLRWSALHLHPLPACHYHLLSCWFLAFHSFPFFFCVSVKVPSLKPILFLFVPSHCPRPLSPPPPHHIHTHSDEQPVKVKRKKSFNLSRKFPFYKSKENIVQELVESEREYPLCHQWGGGGVCFYFLFFLSSSSPRFSSLYHLSSSHSRDVWSVCITLIPASEMPHMTLVMWACLWCVCVCVRVRACVSVGSRGGSSCFCELLAVLT